MASFRSLLGPLSKIAKMAACLPAVKDRIKGASYVTRFQV